MINLKRVVFLSLTVILAGCNGRGLRDAETVLEEGWARVEKEDSESEPPLFCYRTIGDIECYATPDPRRQSQLVTMYPVFKPGQKRLYVEKAQKAPLDMSPNAYEQALENVSYQPSGAQKNFERRSNAYVAVKDDIDQAKQFDDVFFAQEQVQKKRQQKQLQQKKEQEALVVEAKQRKRSVGEIVAELSSKKTQNGQHANVNFAPQNIELVDDRAYQKPAQNGSVQRKLNPSSLTLTQNESNLEPQNQDISTNVNTQTIKTSEQRPFSIK